MIHKMENDHFRQWAHQFADWIADYMLSVEQYPVMPDCRPNDIKNRLPSDPPVSGEPMVSLFSDFKEMIIPGIMHWQHPMFAGYFPASRSEPSVLAEILTAGLGAQCMTWMTSPAAEELEERVMEWLRGMIGLPSSFTGVIQDTASTATLVSILTAREKKTDFSINGHGFQAGQRFRVYASEHAHSSVEKAVRIAGIGRENLILIPADSRFAMLPEMLEKTVLADIQRGYTPLCLVSTLGTTGTAAIDPLNETGNIARKFGIWHHVDAAYAGTALILPEFRRMIDGIETADTFVFNPHKWMFTNFDCTAYFVRDKESLKRTFSVTPEYLKTPEDGYVNNYRDWGIQLGRRFRALKLWFVLRYYGLEGLQVKIRDHIRYAKWLEGQMTGSGMFEIMAPVTFSLVCFRYKPKSVDGKLDLNQINEKLLNDLNHSGKIFLSHTRLNGQFVIRYVAGNVHLTHDHVKTAWSMISQTAEKMMESDPGFRTFQKTGNAVQVLL